VHCGFSTNKKIKVSKMASSVSVANKNKADIRDGNEYKIRKWLVLKFHGSGHLPNHTTSK
jgi:hypothetical protein